VLDRLQRQRIGLGHHKYLNYRRWFRGRLATYVSDRVASVRESPWWNGHVLRTIAESHIRGQANHVKELSAVLTIDAVERTLLNSARAACDGAA
jgi:hypothetical protein